MGKLRGTAITPTLHTACYGFVESNLKCGLLLPGNSTDADRAICGSLPDLSCTPMFKKLGIIYKNRNNFASPCNLPLTINYNMYSKDIKPYIYAM